MRQEPRWLDQPEFDRFMCVTELNLDGPTIVQIADVVYKGQSGVAVTVGNLFGSQTIMVPDFRESLIALNVLHDHCRQLDRAASNKTVKPLNVTKFGWQLLPNKEKTNGSKKEEECCCNEACECGGTCACNR